MTADVTHLREVLADAVVDDPEAGIYRADRRIFTDEEISELEMTSIFEGNWVYLAHESQLPNPGDYFTTYIGRQPVVTTRDKNGELHCLINACAHRGAMLRRRKTDNRMTLTCPFHGWTFRNDGALLKVKDPDGAGYPATLRRGRLARPGRGRAVRQQPRLPLRQPELGRQHDGRASRRHHQGHRHAGRPVARGPGGAARLLGLHLRP
ncbi:Rieske 2Fe-2S domain-containing protein [Geodermatophilus sp. DF01_2]|uniref:Rieske 2Fe-2S domain-containing protein n=1 Tax=Geodermatophilus sp. DF01-2 TaxID=2559610 RepID=UPI002475EF54|nr:Rieske 2Fe-2S domain-containing protein [Geodermatophilus sp. DF01_2]